MSTMLSAGFVGVSSQTNFVRSSRCAASPVEISSGVRNVNRYPFGSYTCVNMR